MIHSEKKTQLVYLYYAYKPKKTHPERIQQMMMKRLIHLLQHIEMNPMVIIII